MRLVWFGLLVKPAVVRARPPTPVGLLDDKQAGRPQGRGGLNHSHLQHALYFFFQYAPLLLAHSEWLFFEWLAGHFDVMGVSYQGPDWTPLCEEGFSPFEDRFQERRAAARAH